jgi:hypothetical protein
MTPAEQLETNRAQHIEEMQEIFSENMASFQKIMPAIANYFSNYTPSSVLIDMDDNGFLNLKQGGSAIYPGDPEVAHRQQFDVFKKNPRHFLFSPSVSTPKKGLPNTFLHSHYLGYIDQLGISALSTAEDDNPRFIPTLLLLGIGMGHHLELLAKYYDIRNLLLYEPNPDVFYASLFTFRYRAILEHFTKGSNSITIKVDGTPDEFCNEVGQLAYRRGAFNISRIYLYRHYNSSVTDETFSRLHEIMHRLMQGWGFFEDEIISLNHTSINIREPMRFIADPSQNKLNHKLPAFIIANGPSLDNDLAYLKAHQDSAIIFSAGSTLYTLYNAGITPDFHIDIERTLGPKVVSEKLPQTYREKVTFLTLNTTHPEVIALFPKRGFALKANDTGTDLIKKCIPEGYQLPLGYSNPLAGNGALAFALRLGFRDLVFFGMDMGTVDKNLHHSTKSSYHTKGHKQYQAGSTAGFKLELPCNRGGTMFTSELLDFSRHAIEAALLEVPGITARNCSIGLTIRGCDVTANAELPYANDSSLKAHLLKTIDSELFVKLDTLENAALSHQPLITEKAAELAQKLLEKARNLQPKTIASTLDLFAEQLKVIESMQEEYPIPARMWTGTLRYLQCNIATWLVRLKTDSKDLPQYITECLAIMDGYIRSVLKLFEEKGEIAFGHYVAEDYLIEPENTKSP